MTPLLRKAVRDLWITRWQALGLALLVAILVTVTAGAIRAGRTLRHTRDTWYERLAMADLEVRSSITASAPIEEARALEGVEDGTAQLLTWGALRREGRRPLPAVIRVLPPEMPAVNRFHLLEGRYPEAGEEGVLLDRSVGRTTGIGVGAKVEVELHGERRVLPVLGVTLSPEFFLTPPHPEYVLPIPGTVGVLGLSSAAAEHFPHTKYRNSFLFRLAPGADPEETRDLIVDTLGVSVESAELRPDMAGHRMSDILIRVQQTYVPTGLLVVLLVGASLIGLVLFRSARLRTREVGVLLSLGYAPLAVAMPRVLTVLLVTALGCVVGCVAHTAYVDVIVEQHVQAFGYAPPIDPGPGKELGLTVLGFLVLGILATLVPVLLAARRSPHALLRDGPASTVGGGKALRLASRLAGFLALPASVTLGLSHAWRQRTSTILTTASLGASFALVIAFACLQHSNLRATTSTVNRIGWDAVVYFTKPVEPLTGDLLAGIHASKVAPAISQEVFLVTETASLAWPVTGLGLDSWVRDLPLARGHGLRSANAAELVLDEWLSKKLGLDIGDHVLGYPYANAPEGVDLEVVGILEGTTLGMAVTSLETARTVHGIPGRYTALHVGADLPAAELSDILWDLPDVEAVISLPEARARALEAIEPLSVIIRLQILGAIAVAVVYLGLLAALDASERASEFAVLRALGWRNRATFLVLGTEVFVRGAMALAVAVPASVVVAQWLIARIEHANGYPLALETPGWVYAATVLSALVAMPLGAWPASRLANRVPPARAIRTLSRE